MRPIGSRVALLLGAVVVALGIAEVLARMLGVGPRFGQLIFVREVPTRIVDGVPLWSTSAPRTTSEEIERAAAAGDAFTIVGLGDSIMYGVGQTEAETYLEQTRRVLAERTKRPIEILNLAVPGFNSAQEDTVYKELDARISPDVVVVNYWVDDPHQYRVVAGHVVDFGNVSEEGRFVVRALPLPARLSDFLLVHSRLYDLLTQAVVALRRGAEVDDWSRASTPLASIRQRVAQAGGRMVVLASPDFSAEIPRPNGDLARLRQLGASQGFEVIDVTDWLPGTSSRQVAQDNCHFNAEGHRRVGERLADYLLSHDVGQ